MLSIAIYSNQTLVIQNLKEKLQNFLIENKIIAKVIILKNTQEFLTVPDSFDIYIIDMDSSDNTVLETTKQMMTIDQGSRFLCISDNESSAYLATKIRANYFLKNPIDENELKEILYKVKNAIKEENIIIKIPSGDRRVRINNINYVNIVKRSLCYHLKDGTIFDGQTLRTSFIKAITPLQNHPQFLFIAPSTLINVNEIKIINKDNIVFDNDEILYIPQKSHDLIKTKWIEYNRI